MRGIFPFPSVPANIFLPLLPAQRNHPIGPPFQASINSNPSILTIPSSLSHVFSPTVPLIPNTKRQNGFITRLSTLSLPLPHPRVPTSTHPRLTALSSALSPPRFFHFRDKGCDISRRPSPSCCPGRCLSSISAHVRHFARAIQPRYGYGRGGACSLDRAKGWHGSAN